MEFLEGIESPLEKYLIEKAQLNKIPLSGTFELTPLCNMNCKMCYVRLTKEELLRQGNLLSIEQWIDIAKSAAENGTLYLLLTGGEPLLYPEFKKLYTVLSQMGFAITINTNGTLIDDDIIELFLEYPPRRINITLYGSSSKSYGELCGVPDNFSKVLTTAELLYKNDIPFRFNYTVTPYNIDDLEEIYTIANKYNVHVTQATYLFPPTRCNASSFYRLSPSQAAKAIIKGNYIQKNITTDALKHKAALDSFTPLNEPPKTTLNGYHCSAGHRAFWVNWKGDMLPCGMMDIPSINLLENTFVKSWEYVVNEVQRIKLECISPCESCSKRNICMTCLAARYCETKDFAGKPEYLCQMVDEEIQYLLPFLNENERKEYKSLVNIEE